MNMHSSQHLDTFLHKMANDDAFRARMLDDPADALDSIGLKVDPTQLPALRSLPSKDAIAADQQAIREKLDGTAGAIPFFLSGLDIH